MGSESNTITAARAHTKRSPPGYFFYNAPKGGYSALGCGAKDEKHTLFAWDVCVYTRVSCELHRSGCVPTVSEVKGDTAIHG